MRLARRYLAPVLARWVCKGLKGKDGTGKFGCVTGGHSDVGMADLLCSKCRSEAYLITRLTERERVR